MSAKGCLQWWGGHDVLLNAAEVRSVWGTVGCWTPRVLPELGEAAGWSRAADAAKGSAGQSIDSSSEQHRG